jgi:tetratricopeptide (TPR) repeat protein
MRMNVWKASRRWPGVAISLLALLPALVSAAPSARATTAARPAAPARSTTPAARLQDTVVSIFVSTLLSNGRGSGFPVGDGSWVVTCYHVVTQHVGEEKLLPVENVLVLSPWSGEVSKARVVATDPKADLALLKLERGRLPVLPVASATAFNPEKVADDRERYTIVGFGQTSAEIEKKPKIQGGTDLVELLAAAEKAERQVLLFAPTQGAGPGWSGGPVVNGRNQVVGVFRALVAQPQAKDVWYPLATGAEPLRTLLKANGVSQGPGAEPLPARPAHADALFQREFRALVWGMARQWDEVETERRAELLLRPGNPIAYMGLSLALLGQNRLEEALKAADTALELDPKRPGALFQKAMILQRMKRLTDAEVCMREAVEMEPDAAERRITLGALLATQGKTGEAIPVLQRAAELTPNHPIAHWRLGLCLQTDGKLEEAIAALRRAVALAEPIGPLSVIRADLAEALSKAGKSEEAERELRDLARSAEDPSIQYQLAALLASRQKSPEALAAVRKCLTLLERNADPELLKRATELKAQLESSAS